MIPLTRDKPHSKVFLIKLQIANSKSKLSMAGKVILAKYPVPKIESQIVKILKQNFSAATELDLK